MAGYVICGYCGLVGHTIGKCPDAVSTGTPVRRGLVLCMPEKVRVADRPRRCGCGVAVIETIEGAVLDDRPELRDRPHVCHITRSRVA